MGLLSFLFSSKPQPVQPAPGGLLTTGATQQAYKDYAEQAMVKGQPVMSFQDWAKAQQAQQPKK